MADGRNTFINDVAAKSPAERAGLKKGQRIVEINGIDVRDKTSKEIAKFIKKHQKDLVIGVLTRPSPGIFPHWDTQ